MAIARRLTVLSLAVLALALLAPLPATAEAKSPSSAMIKKVNKVRAKHGLGPLRTSRVLKRSSTRFSSWLMRTDTFGHRGRVSASGFRHVGEALGMHFGRGTGAGGTLRRWMASPIHRRIVLSGSMRWVGAGATRGRFGRQKATIWVLHVGARRR